MEISKGHSFQTDGGQAVEEAIAAWSQVQRDKIDFLLIYYSTKQSAEQVAAALNHHFPDTPMAGCSTAGEFLDNARYEGSLVILGVHSSGIRWQVGCLTNVHQFDPLTTQPLLEELASGLGTPLGELSPEKHFAIVIQDGLSMKEELITASLAMQLKEVTLLGGSAGDDLQFNKTTQIINGQAVSDAAVVILGESELPFTIIKDQHYVPKGELVVVTDADVKNRRVDTLDGRAAAEVFAELVEVPYDELAAFDFGRNPLIYSERGEHYVRSIQKIEDDGALTFYCAIEPGMLLELGERESPLENLQNSLDKTETSLGSVELLFVFSGILCKLETDDQSERAYWGEMLHQFSNNVIGFDTYGEQLNGLHINQTLVAIGFHNSP